MELLIGNLIPIVFALIFAPGWAERRDLSKGNVTVWACIWSLFLGFLGYFLYWLFLRGDPIVKEVK